MFSTALSGEQRSRGSVRFDEIANFVEQQENDYAFAPSWTAAIAAPTVGGWARAEYVSSDGAGYVYVAGRSTVAPFGQDYFILKYDSGGNELWRAFFGGESGGEDTPTAIAVDADGNVCVTGFSRAEDGTYDFLTVKLDASGHEIWSAVWSGSPESDDVPVAIVIDSRGNVVVTGSGAVTYNEHTGISYPDYDYVTVKYDPTGREVWWANFDASDSASDRHRELEGATALAVDSSDAVYVTGGALNESSKVGYLTIKYFPEGGVVWTKRYEEDGPNSLRTRAEAIAIDHTGSVYVSGSARLGETPQKAFTTVAYDAGSGETKWIHQPHMSDTHRDSPSRIASDPRGGVVVAGTGNDYSGSQDDILVVAYDEYGEMRWSARYDHENLNQSVRDLAVDQAGRVYVIGSTSTTESGLDFVTLALDANGNEQWVDRFDGPLNADDVGIGVALSGGRIAIAGSSAFAGVFTRWYERNGSVAQTVQYVPPNTSLEYLYDVAVHPSGDIIAAGARWHSSTGWDLLVSRLTAEGDVLWDKGFDGGIEASDEMIEMNVAPNGDIYINGIVLTEMGIPHALVMKVSDSGQLLWTRRGVGEITSAAISSAVDRHGNAYVTGSIGSGEESDCLTVMYGPGGEERWIARYDGLGGADLCRAIAVDGDGNVLVTGTTRTTTTGLDLLVVKYDSAGAEQWAFQEPASAGMAIDVDNAQDIVVATSVRDGDIRTFRLSSDGAEVWRDTYDTGGHENRASGMRIDPQGDIYVVGTGGNRGRGVVTIKYSREGEMLWDRLIELDQVVVPTDLAADTKGITVAGMRQLPSGVTNFVAARYSANGHLQWLGEERGMGEMHPSMSSALDTPAREVAVALDGEGDAYVVGTMFGSSEQWSAGLLMKFDVPGVSTERPSHPIHALRTLSVYPNPTSGETTVRIQHAGSQIVNLVVYDLQGRQVRTLFSGFVQNQLLDVVWDGRDDAGQFAASGVYLLRVQAATEVTSATIVVI